MALSEQEQIRRDTLQRMRDLGMDPYPAAAVEVSHHAAGIKADFNQGAEVKMAGRIMGKRIMGKASFAELMDSTGRIQLYFNRDEICPGEDKSLYNEVFKKLIDIGDFVSLTGTQFKTQTGSCQFR